VDADRFEGGLKQDLSVLTGNVRITQGSIVGTGGRADIHQKDSAVTRVVLTGTPATFQQDIEGGGTMKGRAQSIDYDPDAKHAVLSGDAVVEHPDGEARGARLTYDVDTGKMSGDGQGGDGACTCAWRPGQGSGADKKKSDKDGAKGAEKKPDGSAEKGASAAASPGAPAQPS
jgi:lipopolysaccharide export system protein LptA